MIESFKDTLEFFPAGLVYVALGIIVLVAAKIMQDLVTPYRINDQLTHKDNVSLGLSITGYYLGVIFVFLGALYQPLTPVSDVAWWEQFDGAFWLDVLEVLLYAIVGIVVLNIFRIIVDRIILFKFETEKEIVEKRNTGAGAVEFGVYAAVGIVISGAIAGSGADSDSASVVDSAVRSLAFLGLGMVVLVAYTFFYQVLTPFDMHDEIGKGNAAVGVALGGNLIAIGIVTFKSIFGEFLGWGESIAAFLTFAVLGFVLLYVVRMLVDLVLLPGTRVSHELAVDRNLGAAFIEGAVVISASLILYFAI